MAAQHVLAAQEVLSEDWSEYEHKKKRYRDRMYFFCDEQWEVDYLVNKITKTHPSIAVEQIRRAIASAGNQIRGYRPRAQFVQCVMEKLGFA